LNGQAVSVSSNCRRTDAAGGCSAGRQSHHLLDRHEPAVHRQRRTL